MKQVIDRYKLDINLFSNTEVLELLDFEQLPILYVKTDPIGTLYLSYLDKYLNENIEQRLVIKISKEQLEKVKKGLISVKSVFKSPETPYIFLVHLNQLNGNIENSYLLPNDIFQQFNTIDENYYIQVDEEDVEVAKQKKYELPIAHYDETFLDNIWDQFFNPSANEIGISVKHIKNVEKIPYQSSKIHFSWNL